MAENGAKPDFTVDEAIAELKRETAIRRQYYPKAIERGTMTEEKAKEHGNKLLAAIWYLRDYQKLLLNTPE